MFFLWQQIKNTFLIAIRRRLIWLIGRALILAIFLQIKLTKWKLYLPQSGKIQKLYLSHNPNPILLCRLRFLSPKTLWATFVIFMRQITKKIIVVKAWFLLCSYFEWVKLYLNLFLYHKQRDEVIEITKHKIEKERKTEQEVRTLNIVLPRGNHILPSMVSCVVLFGKEKAKHDGYPYT